MPEDQWWGYSSEHGWVVLDRTNPNNQFGSMYVVFTRCRDWIDFNEERINWNLPKYIYAPNFIKKLSRDAAIKANQQYLKLRDEWTARNKQIRKEKLENEKTRVFVKNLMSDFEKISCFFHYKIMWEHSAYLRISEHDKKLAKLWFSDSEKNFTYHQARMLSARFAEKIAMEFYESIGYEVRDISITQLTKKSEDWKLYDILLDDKIAVDVKNSRNPVSSQIRYVEYCIPRFKETRYGDQIKIAGVMSPYLSLEYLHEPLKTNFLVRPIIYLGETTKQDINEISERFNAKNLQIKLDDKSILPPWIFSYPDRYYKKRNIELNALKSLIENSNESNFILNQLSKKLLMEPYDVIPTITSPALN